MTFVLKMLGQLADLSGASNKELVVRASFYAKRHLFYATLGSWGAWNLSRDCGGFLRR
jgi:hypothetical protein